MTGIRDIIHAAHTSNDIMYSTSLKKDADPKTAKQSAQVIADAFNKETGKHVTATQVLLTADSKTGRLNLGTLFHNPVNPGGHVSNA